MTGFYMRCNTGVKWVKVQNTSFHRKYWLNGEEWVNIGKKLQIQVSYKLISYIFNFVLLLNLLLPLLHLNISFLPLFWTLPPLIPWIENTLFREVTWKFLLNLIITEHSSFMMTRKTKQNDTSASSYMH